MALTVDQIIAKLAHKAFCVNKGRPDCPIIHSMWSLLYGNTSNLTTKLGGVNHRHIGIIMRDTLYTTILPTPYNAPVETGGTSTVPPKDTTEV